MTTIILAYIFIIGAIVGSFLNVVIYRYPIMLNLEWKNECLEFLNQTAAIPKVTFNLLLPRSHCPSCKKLIPFWHNIPIISYLILRGKCANCSVRISIQYPLVELLTAILSVLVFLKFGLTLPALSIWIFTCGLITLSFIDLEHQILPDLLTLSLLWLGLFVSTQHYFIASSTAIIGALVGYLFLFVIAKLYFYIRKTDGMGYGDCKMLGLFGAWLGIIPLINVLLISAVLGLLINIILIALKKADKNKPLPFGPYLAIAGWLTAMYGPFILNWYGV